jgi:hypothetical protein
VGSGGAGSGSPTTPKLGQWPVGLGTVLQGFRFGRRCDGRSGRLPTGTLAESPVPRLCHRGQPHLHPGSGRLSESPPPASPALNPSSEAVEYRGQALLIVAGADPASISCLGTKRRRVSSGARDAHIVQVTSSPSPSPTRPRGRDARARRSMIPGQAALCGHVGFHLPPACVRILCRGGRESTSASVRTSPSTTRQTPRADQTD